MPDGGDVARVPTRRIMRVAISVGTRIAAINVSANATRTGVDDIRATLLATAQAIERDLAAGRREG